MEYILIAFSSRESAIKFYNILKNTGITAQLVNTPKEANVGCGLSIKTVKGNLAVIKKMLVYYGVNNFRGIFSVKNNYGKIVVTSI